MLEPIIKGCPFCGNDPYYVEGFDYESVKYSAAIVCADTLCPVKPELVMLDEVRFRVQLKDRIIAAWNKRVKV